MSGLFFFQLFEQPWAYVAWVLVVTFSICVHEFAHAWAGAQLGDDTAAAAGHLSLDPRVQMGPRSIAMLLIFGLAWGAAPFSPRRLGRGARTLVAVSGSAANLLLAALFAAACAAAVHWGRPMRIEGAPALLALAARANATLAIFNLLPLPPLDGWSAVEEALPPLASVRLRWGPTFSLAALAILFLTPLFGLVWRAGDAMAAAAVAGWLRLLSAV